MTESIPSLAVSVGGISLPNPFLLASAPPTAGIEGIRKAFALGWGGAVLKTITAEHGAIRDASPRFAAVRDAAGRTIGFENIELLSRRSLAYWKDGVVSLKRDFPDRAVIASVMAPVAREAWRHVVGEMQTVPIDALELNFSCPHGMPEKGMGMAIGADAGVSARITEWVKDIARTPVFVKLSPNVTDIAAIALAVKNAGADGLSAINTVHCLAGVDLDTLEPLPSVNGRTALGGYSGPAVKPIGLRCVAQIKAATGLPILAMGGVSTWRDAVEYLAVGGDAVEVCTEVMLNGYGVIRNMTSGLGHYLAEKNLPSPEALRGVALGKIVSHNQVAAAAKRFPTPDARLCGGCGTCAVICSESGYGAITMADRRAVVDREVCDGCGLCVIVCPACAMTW